MQKRFGIAVIAALIATPASLGAQGLIGGAENGAQRGADQGDAVGGPIGGIVGGVVGGATGAAAGLLGIDQGPRFRDYALREHRSAFRYDERLAPGVRLPLNGVTYYAVPEEYGVDPRYRYTIVNDHAVLVDPATRRIVQVID